MSGRKRAKSLAQIKIDVAAGGWPWPIDHPNDERALLDGCRPEFAAAERVRQFFFDLLCLPAEGGGVRPFVLMNWWYVKILAPIFGWKRADGRRRFDKAFITTAKKSGKSTVLSGLPLYMILADGEEEAEAYSAAVDRDQAKIVYRKASRMTAQSPELSRVLKRVDSQSRIVHHATGSWYEAIASDADSADGKNPHLLVVDELHRWRKKEFFNALMYGDLARSQPLFLMITTAGDDCHSVGYEEYEFAKELLDPANEFYSMSHFAFIAEAAPEREWDDPEGWKEANPSLLEGFGSVEKLQSKCDEAKQSPRKKREFIRFITNRWVDAADDTWLSEDGWRSCAAAVADHAGDDCWGALDLSTSRDLTALTLAFWAGDADDVLDLLWWFWMPAENLAEKEHLWRVPLRRWVDEGWIRTTPGNVTDYAYIRQALTGVTLDEHGQPLPDRAADCLASQYEIQAVAFDPWNASKLVTELGEYDGLMMLEHRQGYGSMNVPSKEFERRVSSSRIRHGDNPVANWMARHCVVDDDPAGNIKPNKRKSRHKIDGIVTGVMASGLAVASAGGGGSFYDNNDVEIV